MVGSFLPDHDAVIGDDLPQMLFQDHAGDGPGGPQEAVRGQLAAGVEFRIEQVGLDQLADLEQAALEPGFGRFQDFQLRLQPHGTARIAEALLRRAAGGQTSAR